MFELAKDSVDARPRDNGAVKVRRQLQSVACECAGDSHGVSAESSQIGLHDEIRSQMSDLLMLCPGMNDQHVLELTDWFEARADALDA